MERKANSSVFRRRWVIQEYALSFWQGRYVLLGDSVVSAARKMLGRFNHLQDAIAFQANLENTPTSEERPLLIQNLDTFDAAQCSEPRDMVIALLGLSSDMKTSSHQFRASYSIPVGRLFRDLAEHYLRADRDYWESDSEWHVRSPVARTLAVLACAVARPPPLEQEALPWWIPDWRNRPTFVCEEHEAVTRAAVAFDDCIYQKEDEELSRPLLHASY